MNRLIYSVPLLVVVFCLTTAPVRAVLTAPASPGAHGEQITELQQLLADLGYLKHAATGYFGALTQQALSSYQHASGLAALGVLTPPTSSALNAYSAFKQSSLALANTSSDFGINSTLASLGSTGSTVTSLQVALQKLRYLSSAPTGYFGTQTSAAVSAFQRVNGLPVTGTLTSTTWYLIRLAASNASSAQLTSAPHQSVSVTPSHISGPILSAPSANSLQISFGQGSSGSAVIALQSYLISQGFSISAGATGYFGGQTLAALLAYQRAHNAALTGTYEPAQFKKLAEAVSTPPSVALTTPALPTTKSSDIQLIYTASATSVKAGSSVTLHWTSGPDANCQASGDWSGSRTSSGSQDVSPSSGTSNYGLLCTYPDGLVYSKSISIATVIPAANDQTSTAVPSTSTPLSLSISASKSSIRSGDSVIISWVSAGAASCAASMPGWSTVQPTSGSVTVPSVTATQTYTLSCAASNGSQVTKSVSVTVTAPTIQTSATSANPLTGQAPGVGAPDIATTDHNVMSDLITSSIPSSGSTGSSFDVGAFRFTCGHTNIAYDDPTVYPNQPGVSHLHDQTGVRGWNAFSNYGNLRTGGGGSDCNNVEGYDGWLSLVPNPSSEHDWAANRTPYWQPALLDGKGNVIASDFISVYYKRMTLTNPHCSNPLDPQYLGKCVKLPNGIKYIFGAFPTDSSKAPDAVFSYICTGGASGSIYEGSTDPTKEITFDEAIQCAKAHSGGTLEVRVDGPSCWDGVTLDSANHRSHLAYPSYGWWGYAKCDAQHPYVIPTFTYASSYTILPTDTGDIHWSSDEMDNTKPRGWSFHVDYGPAAWDPTVLAMWEDNCIDKLLSCSAGNLGNGYALKGAGQGFAKVNNQYIPYWRNPQRLVPVPPKPQSMGM